ncbi:hypothetical protein A2U01_0096175, partial [Trifolium medium]|nr:hypothetical protein [Trifolium medium]
MMEFINVVIDDSATDHPINVETDVAASDQLLDISLDSDSKPEESNSKQDNIPTNK